MATTTILSSVGTSAPLLLDFIGARGTTAQVTLASTTMTVSALLQMTLDSSAQGVDSPVWSLASSIAITSAIADSGMVVALQTPVAGLRISSTAISSSSIRLKALQNAGG